MNLPKFLRENFRLLKLIHSSDKTKICLVEELSSSQKFLLKVINRTGLLYSQIAGIKNASLPEISHVEENIVEQSPEPAENFIDEEIPAPLTTKEPIYYEQHEPSAEIEPTKPKWDIDFSAADSSEVRELGIPRKILEERGSNADDYYKHMELNARQKEFEQSLPDDMTVEEKNEASMEFRRRTKDAIGLK